MKTNTLIVVLMAMMFIALPVNAAFVNMSTYNASVMSIQNATAQFQPKGSYLTLADLAGYRTSAADDIQDAAMNTTMRNNVSLNFYDKTYIDAQFASEDVDTQLSVPVKAAEIIKKGQAVYISGSDGANLQVSLCDPESSTKSRILGLAASDMAANANGYVRRNGNLSALDTRSTNIYINPYQQTWAAGDLLFAETGGGLSNVRNNSGRTVKAAYVSRTTGADGALVVYPFENPVWITAAQNENVTLRIGDTQGKYQVSIRNDNNKEVANITSLGNLYVNATAGTLANYRTSAADDAQDAQYQTINNESVWDMGYTLQFQHLTGTWTNSTTYYFGAIPAAVTSTAGQRHVYVPRGGNITRAEVWMASGTAGSDQPWTMELSINGNTAGNTSYIGNVSSLNPTPLFRRWSNTTMKIQVNTGDYLEIKTPFQLFPVKPATSIGGATLYIGP